MMVFVVVTVPGYTRLLVCVLPVRDRIRIDIPGHTTVVSNTHIRILMHNMIRISIVYYDATEYNILWYSLA